MTQTLLDWIHRHSHRVGDGVAVVTEHAGGTVTTTWRELAERVARYRGGLRAAGVQPDDRVALSLPNGADLIAAFAAVTAEGATVAVLPLPRGHRDGAYVSRTVGVWEDCTPTVLIETADVAERRRRFAELEALPALTVEALAGATAQFEAAVPVDPARPVFLQYTSGSTSRPRGVRVTHEMIDASCRQAVRTYRETTEDVAVSWVPLYHDMGLLTALLRPLYTGYTTVLLQPAEFVAEPLRWLRALSTHRGTLASAPDFAYAHCVRRITPDQLRDLDLSTWRVARNAGERVRPETLEAFVGLTGVAGFSPDAFCPSYGMAEATLTVTATTPEVRPLRLRVARRSLEEGQPVVTDPAGEELLSSGPPVPGTTVEVAGAAGRDGIVGELEVTGPQVAASYYSQPLRTSPEGALRTGDLGFTLQGHVFVLGRRDDVLIVNGVNYFQQDIVAACAAVPGVRTGRVAAFVDDRDAGQQIVVVLAETSAAFDELGPQTTTAAIRRSVREAVGVMVGPVQYVAPGELPVTTSGKVRVAAARERWRMSEEVVA